jgi:hypothetical protein
MIYLVKIIADGRTTWINPDKIVAVNSGVYPPDYGDLAGKSFTRVFFGPGEEDHFTFSIPPGKIIERIANSISSAAEMDDGR